MHQAVVVFVPPPLNDEIREMQLGFDPGLRPHVAPHVTMKRHFAPLVRQEEVESAVSRAVQGMAPIEMSVGGTVTIGPTGGRAIVCSVAEDPRLRTLHGALLHELDGLVDNHPSGNLNYEGEHWLPHVTILYHLDEFTYELTWPEFSAYAPQQTFIATEAALVGADEGNNWRVVRTFPFARAKP